MNIKEFYDFIGEDYNEVIGRLRVESRIIKYVSKFPTDTCFGILRAAVKEKNYTEAFRAAHTLKGICLNLGFSSFFTTVSEITEKLRNHQNDADVDADGSVSALVEEASDKYSGIISGIYALDK